MLLKKITLVGFKSFADKAEMFLNQGVTALVGPNGCGKSNIVDAIRWVLGEQSIKVLRGGKNEDVIFNGCETRKASGMAEVTLTFDNSAGKLPIDFNEVSVSRRLFRSGESQYLINKTQCRLKDIHQLFMDTGIGTSSYSIIEQGEMDWIINAKPVERREIFEEAAGITKYKVKRKEAERKLKYAEDNLLRLNDIINELQSQINTVSRQAAKAKRFQKLSSELQFLDCQHSVKKYLSLESQIEEDKKTLLEGENLIVQHRNDISNYEQKHHEELTQLNDWDTFLKDLTKKHFEIENEINQIRQNIEFKNSRISDIQTRINEEFSGKEIYAQKFQELQSIQEQSLLSKNQLWEQINQKNVNLEEISGRINRIVTEIDEKKRFIFEFKEKLENLKSQSSETQNKIIEFEILEKNFEEQWEKISDEISEIQLSLNFEEDQLAASQSKTDSLKQSFEEISEGMNDKEKINQQKARELNEIEAAMLKISTELSEKNSRKDALEELKNSYEGFFTGVRALMLQKKENPDEWTGIIGTVPDIIKVRNGYEIAAEAALGARVQNIIVQKGDDAKTAINFLKKHRLGRVTFLPLDLIQSGDERMAPGNQRILGRLLDFIDYEAIYKHIMESLLGSYLVVRTIDDAISLVREGIRNYNFITLEGELIARSGAITGGESKSAVKGFFSRENEISELDQKIQQLRNSIIQKNASRNEAKSIIEQLQMELEILKSKKNTLFLDLQQSERELQKYIFQRDAFKKRLDVLYAEQEKIMHKKEDLGNQRSHLKETLDTSTQEDSSIRETISGYERGLEESYQQLTSEKEKHAKEQADLENLSEKLTVLETRIKEIRNEIKERKDWLDNLENNQNQQKQIMENLVAEISQAEEKLNSLVIEQQNLSEEIEKTKSNQQELKQKTEDFDLLRKDLQSSIDKLQEKNTNLKVRVAEMEGKMNNLREHLFSKYQVRIEQISLEENGVSIPWEEVPQKIDELESKIKNLGSVNLSAIEELQKLEERFNFLNSQQKDLNSAKDQLMEIIQKINVSATQLFNETFEKVKVYFSDIFSELFRGGKAELKLESEDILDAGIDIVARPPGKTPQTISLLSGGEKCLTATALLFALFKVKPSPFCFVDELDAPLDDSNISRFTRLVESFSSSTQFIIITHNKNTLRIADLMYGVTQQEKGTSKLVSVKFVDDKIEDFFKDPPASEETPARKRVITLKEDEELAKLVLPEIQPVQLTIPEPATEGIDNPGVRNRLTEAPPLSKLLEDRLNQNAAPAGQDSLHSSEDTNFDAEEIALNEATQETAETSSLNTKE